MSSYAVKSEHSRKRTNRTRKLFNRVRRPGRKRLF